MSTSRCAWALLAVATIPLACASAQDSAPSRRVRTQRLPDGAMQPQVAVDSSARVHLIYLLGEPNACDVYYRASTDDGVNFSPPRRVNTRDGAAIATGTIRGAQLALGRNGRVHVAWNGSAKAANANGGRGAPMLYTRLADDGLAFEPERNVIYAKAGLDGGGSIAADAAGNVYVAWHAPTEDGGREDSRRVWIARSTDDGRTFAFERAAFDRSTGACGCCGMRLFCTRAGRVLGLYRTATESVERGMFLLSSADGTRFRGGEVSALRINTCVMSSAFLAETAQGVFASWETKDQVVWARVDASIPAVHDPHSPPAAATNRKYPALAAGADGRVLVCWVEGAGWAKGGRLAWQICDGDGRPLPGAAGAAPGVPVWSFAAPFATRDGGFVILY